MHSLKCTTLPFETSLKTSEFYKTTLRPTKCFRYPPSFRIFETRKGIDNFLVSGSIRQPTKIRQPPGYLQIHEPTMENLSFRPKRHQDLRTLNNLMINTNDRYTWVSTNVIYGIKIYIREIERKLAECFRERLRDVQEDKLRAISTSRTSLSTTWRSHGTVFPYTKETQKTIKTLNNNLSFNLALSTLTESINASRPFNLFIYSYHQWLFIILINTTLSCLSFFFSKLILWYLYCRRSCLLC